MLPDNGSPTSPYIVSLDIGSSSVRTLVTDVHGAVLKDVGEQITYRFKATPDGAVSLPADELFDLVCQSLDKLEAELKQANVRPEGVGVCTFWHSLLGVDEDGAPTTELLHLLDVRSAPYAEKLASEVDGGQWHSRTGCVLHASYWPAKLYWLRSKKNEEWSKTTFWWSIGEYLFRRFFGRPAAEAASSVSMASATGIWHQNNCDYDEEALQHLQIDRSKLARVEKMDEPLDQLAGEFASRWPSLAGIPWFPAIGDGAANNLGSGCFSKREFALMVGTTGAMRAILEQDSIDIPQGLWCYRVDRRRLILGGALSNGGEVFAWSKRSLRLPDEDQLEKELAAMAPGSHGLTVLPLFAGERSPKWRSDVRAAFTGLGLHTEPIHMVRAALESVSLRFREIYEILQDRLGAPEKVVGSGGAMLHSPAWTQMMADALGHTIIPCLVHEASSRGIALLAMERLKLIDRAGSIPVDFGPPVDPKPEHKEAYQRMFEEQRVLYSKLFEEGA